VNRKERTLVVALGMSFILVTAQIALAYFSGSLALKAEAWHVFADFFVGVATLIGLRIARREKDVYKTGISVVENVVAILIAFFILYVGFDIVRTIATEEPNLRNLGWVIAGAVLTIGLSWIIARYEMYVGRQTQSPSLMATARHDMLDVYAHIVVLVGLAGAALGFTNMDRLAALIVVFFVAHSSWDILNIAIMGLRRRRVLIALSEHAHEHQHEHEPSPGHSHLRGGQFHTLLPIAGIVLLVLYLLSGFYTVRWDERAAVRRFGRVIDEVRPGLHYRLPWPVDQVDRIPSSQVRRIETPGTLILTGDENLVTVRLGVHYIVRDATTYLFKQRDPEALVAGVAEAAMRRVAAEEAVDSILTRDKNAIEAKATALIQQMLDDYQAGVQLTDVQILESSPPSEVADAFRDVASAREDQNTYINEARAYENEQIALSRGEAATVREGATAYRGDKVNAALGEGINFLSRRHAYVESPEVTQQRLYLETVERVLAGIRKYLVDPSIELIETDLWFLQQGVLSPPAEAPSTGE
jgi:membrane protease subunit HflK